MFLSGLLSIFTSIGVVAILPSFVEKTDLETANAVSQISVQTGYFIGPALGGFLTAIIGAPLTLLINVLFFFLASFLYYLIPNEIFHRDLNTPKTNSFVSLKTSIRNFWQDTKEGVLFLWSFPVLISIPFITLFFNLTYAPMEPVLPAFISSVMQAGSESLGTLWTVFAAGSFLGAMFFVKINKRYTYSFALGGTILLWGIAATVLGFVPNLFWAFIIMFLGGIFYAPYNIIAPTLEQKLIPNHIRGRVLGVIYLISGLSFPLGTYLGGILGEILGIRETMILSGLATMALGVTVMLLKPLKFKEAPVLTKESDSISLRN